MTSFMRLLRSAAQKHGLCVLVSIPSLVRICALFGLCAKLKWRDVLTREIPAHTCRY